MGLSLIPLLLVKLPDATGPARGARRRACLFCLLLLTVVPACAHKGSDAYLDVRELVSAAPNAAMAAEKDYRFSLAIAIKDLDLLVPIDTNADGKVTWGEIRTAMPLVQALANETANLETRPPAQPHPVGQPAASACHLNWQSDGVDQRSDGHYIRLSAQARCPNAQTLAFHYTLLRDQDANHRLLVAGRLDGKDLLTTTSPQQPSLVLRAGTTDAPGVTAASDVQRPSNAWSALGDYFSLGVHHLLQGYDHLAFLLALVLPLRLVLFRPAAGVSRAPTREWMTLLRTVTAFTVGHSLTLILATFGLTEASPHWVEPAIALTIVFTALLNLRPLPWVRTDVLALLFGMVHGYGFAGLLLEAAAPSGLLPWALAGFNLGVEAGQLIAVCGWVLVSQPLVVRRWYPSLVVRLGSVVLALLALWWFWQRVR
jgi:hydrogenase/urease accessory protein HupE